MAEFTIKQNDTRPKLVATLYDNFEEEGQEPINLATAAKVFMILRKQKTSGEAYLRKECNIDNEAGGIVSYGWGAEDLKEVATYDLEFEIEWEDGGIETVPNTGYATVKVEDDLG